MELPDPGQRDVEPFSDADLVALRKAANALDAKERTTGPHRALRSYRLALELALATGCRVAELGALEWSAIDAEDMTVRVQWQVPPFGDPARLQPLKGRKARTALVLPSWWDFHDPDATGRVLLAPGAAPAAHRSVERWYDAILDTAGLKRVGRHAHACRHTYARLALEQGARLEELQRFLGHASIRTTEAYYGHLTEQSAATLARSRIYGVGLQLVKPGAKENTAVQRRTAGG